MKNENAAWSVGGVRRGSEHKPASGSNSTYVRKLQIDACFLNGEQSTVCLKYGLEPTKTHREVRRYESAIKKIGRSNSDAGHCK